MRSLFIAALALTGCAPKLEPKPFDAGTPVVIQDDAGQPIDGGIKTSMSAIDGGIQLSVDGTSSTEWVYFDLDLPAEVEPEAPGWDLKFQRFSIGTNGGISGDAGVEVAIVDAGTLAEVTTEPPGPWLVDAPDGDDVGDAPDLAFLQQGAWYAYDEMFHTLTPRPWVYVVRSTDQRLYAIKIISYYDLYGTSGVWTVDWKPLQQQ